MTVSKETVDVLIWSLIYAGLLLLCLGMFVRRELHVLGWGLVAGGGIAAAAGALLVRVRSRMGA